MNEFISRIASILNNFTRTILFLKNSHSIGKCLLQLLSIEYLGVAFGLIFQIAVLHLNYLICGKIVNISAKFGTFNRVLNNILVGSINFDSLRKGLFDVSIEEGNNVVFERENLFKEFFVILVFYFAIFVSSFYLNIM